MITSRKINIFLNKLKIRTIHKRLAMFIRISFEVVNASTYGIVMVNRAIGVNTTRPWTWIYTFVS